MLQLLLVAFTIGIVGSFHCVGMCGPLALALPLRNDSFVSRFSGALIYNAGRIVTYSFFGALFGLIGESFSLFGIQQWLSVIAGITMLFFILMPRGTGLSSSTSSFITHRFSRLRTSLGQLLFDKKPSTLFSIGLLNGLLPCGLVYMAVAGAVATADMTRSIMFMAAFGLGTLPVMWATAFFGNYIGIRWRQKIRAAFPYMMTLMACLLILRGMGLGIPYVSPKIKTEERAVVECCIKH
jgi:uncharacterized protein